MQKIPPSPQNCNTASPPLGIGKRSCPHKTDRPYPESQCFQQYPSPWCSARCAPCPYEIEKIPVPDPVDFGTWLYQERKAQEWRRLSERHRHSQVVKYLKEKNLGGICEETLKGCPLALYSHKRQGRLDGLRIFRQSPKNAPAGHVQVHPGGLQLSRAKNYQAREKAEIAGGGDRGEIQGFSLASRRRCINRLMGFDWAALASKSKRSVESRAFFATLTYPAKFPTDSQKFKRHLDNLFRRLKHARNYGKMPFRGAFWKCEPQRRGAPHYHLLLVFDGEVNRRILTKWLAIAWFEICGSRDDRHKKAGVDVRTVYGHRTGKLMAYMGKYLGKVIDQLPFKYGRLWGEVAADKRVGEKIPRGKTQTFELPDQENWVALVRRVRTWGKNIRFIRSLSPWHRGAVLIGYGQGLQDLLRDLDFRWCDELAGPDGSPF